MLQLYNLNKEKIEGLTKYKDLKIESTLSTGDKVLSFLYPKKDSNNVLEEGYIRTKIAEFVIKQINKTSDSWITVTCSLNVEELETMIEDFDSTEQPIENCINFALAGTGWTVNVDRSITKRRTVRKTNSSIWDIIQQAKKTYRVEIEFDTINRIVIVKEKIGGDKGVYFTEELNLKSLSIQSNSYDFYTRILAIGKDDLKVEVENYSYSNKRKTLIWKDERYTDETSLREDAILKLNEISKPYRAYSADVIDLAKLNEKYKDILSYKLGDTITLISKENGIKEKQRIVKTVEYPDDPSQNTVEIANTTLSFEDIQKEFQDTSDTVNNITEDDGTISEGAIKETVKKLTADKINVQELNAVIIRVGNLEATKANITDLTAINAKIANLQADKANITDLTATNIKFNVGTGGTLDLQTLLSKFVTGENGQFLNLTT
ncbi:phage tail protein, partial [Clostridium nigeriense]|uniref:phage tail protein n=1 Tax=Clostridium nigeriense TaxID=1805470 RepID=UPI003D34288A